MPDLRQPEKSGVESKRFLTHNKKGRLPVAFFFVLFLNFQLCQFHGTSGLSLVSIQVIIEHLRQAVCRLRLGLFNSG